MLNRLILAIKAFFMVLKGEELILKSQIPQPKPQPKPEKKPEKKESAVDVDKIFRDGAVYTLLLLQREGRLVDFLQEDIGAFSDDQIGTAVRRIHAGCAGVLQKNFGVAPMMDKREMEVVSVPDTYDPSQIKLTGNVPENPPYKGTLQHKGWQAAKIHFPTRTGQVDTTVIHAAEVEM